MQTYLPPFVALLPQHDNISTYHGVDIAVGLMMFAAAVEHKPSLAWHGSSISRRDEYKMGFIFLLVISQTSCAI